MNGRRRTLGARAALLGAVLAAFVALAACGQRGPLTLPGSEQPEQRTDPSSVTGPAATDARPEDEDEPVENER
jgi:predicted small lipoprotein YifL